jgi:hypothetical protein
MKQTFKKYNVMVCAFLIIAAIVTSCSKDRDDEPTPTEKQADVDVVGQETNGANNVAKVWKNGTELYNLNNGAQDAFARSLFVLGNDVYVAGYEHNGTVVIAKPKYGKTVWSFTN